MNGYLKNSFLIVSVLFLSTLLLHSCGPKKQEPDSVEKRLLGTWEYAGYRVNGENWNDTAAKYGFNYPIRFNFGYDTKGQEIENRTVSFVRDSLGGSCLYLSNYYFLKSDIKIFGFYSDSYYDTTTKDLITINCIATMDEYNQKIPVFYDTSAAWSITFQADLLKLSKTYNSNFYEWIFKK